MRPHGNLAVGLLSICGLCEDLKDKSDCMVPPFWLNLVIAASEAVVYLSFALLLDRRELLPVPEKHWYLSQDEVYHLDEDVAAESHLVAEDCALVRSAGTWNGYALRIAGLRKLFQGKKKRGGAI